MKQLVVHQILQRTIATHADQLIVSGDSRLTYLEFYKRVLRLASSLQDLGVGKGTVIGMLEVNTHRNLELHFATSMLGAVLHTINFRLPAENLIYTMEHAENQWVFVSELFLSQLQPVMDKFPNWVVMGKEKPKDISSSSNIYAYEELISKGREEEISGAEKIREDDNYSILYTTGTTGKPKGIPYRHRDVLLGSLQLFHHLALHKTGAKINSSDTIMPLIPFFHIHGWGTAFFGPYLGAKMVLPERADAKEQAELMQKEGVTWANLVPTQMHMLLEQEKFGNIKVLTGGSPLTSGLAERAEQAGLEYSLIYGGSDQLATAISVLPEGVTPDTQQSREWLRTGMKPVPMVDLDLRDAQGNKVSRDGESIGEVWVSSPWLPGGYLKNQEKSKEVFVNGWFRTGDIGVIYENGLLYVMDRQSDAIKSGGEWIPSGVLEAHISEHPGVEIASVIPKPDERWGERPMAIVKSSQGISGDDLKNFLLEKVNEGKLAKFWVPNEYSFVQDIPLTSAGKIDKLQLKQKIQNA